MPTKLRSYLRRYTDLPALLHILRKQQITLLDPQNWDDTNDSYFLPRPSFAWAGVLSPGAPVRCPQLETGADLVNYKVMNWNSPPKRSLSGAPELEWAPVIFQDVVHSIGTREADCDEQSSFRGKTE